MPLRVKLAVTALGGALIAAAMAVTPAIAGPPAAVSVQYHQPYHHHDYYAPRHRHQPRYWRDRYGYHHRYYYWNHRWYRHRDWRHGRWHYY